MKAEEIRSKVLRNVHHISPEWSFGLEVLQEIAAQLAEMNEAYSASVKPRTTFTEAEWNGDSISVESFLAPPAPLELEPAGRGRLPPSRGGIGTAMYRVCRSLTLNTAWATMTRSTSCLL